MIACASSIFDGLFSLIFHIYLLIFFFFFAFFSSGLSFLVVFPFHHYALVLLLALTFANRSYVRFLIGLWDFRYCHSCT